MPDPCFLDFAGQSAVSSLLRVEESQELLGFSPRLTLREAGMDQLDFNKLWQNFVDTITSHYSDFGGRVSRAQFWYYVLVYVVVGFLVAIVGAVGYMLLKWYNATKLNY